MNEPNQPSIDERLEALTQSLEILTHDVHDMQSAMQQMQGAMQLHLEQTQAADARERRGRDAILRGIAAYLQALNDGDGGEISPGGQQA